MVNPKLESVRDNRMPPSPYITAAHRAHRDKGKNFGVSNLDGYQVQFTVADFETLKRMFKASRRKDAAEMKAVLEASLGGESLDLED